MQVNIEDEYMFKTDLQKIDIPQNDAERIYNNVYDFINSLIISLNEN